MIQAKKKVQRTQIQILNLKIQAVRSLKTAMTLGLKTILQTVQARKDPMRDQIRKLQKVKVKLKVILVQIPDHQMKLEQLKLKLAAARPMPALIPIPWMPARILIANQK